jgi:hypothetical protein
MFESTQGEVERPTDEPDSLGGEKGHESIGHARCGNTQGRENGHSVGEKL